MDTVVGKWRWILLLFDPFVVLKWTVFLLIMHFAKPRVYRANRHPEHHNRRRTSTSCHSCLKWFWEVDNDVIYVRQTQPAKFMSYVLHWKFETHLETIKHAYKIMLKKYIKNKRKTRNKERKRKTEKRALLKKKCHKKVSLSDRTHDDEFRVQCSYHFITDIHELTLTLSYTFINSVFTDKTNAYNDLWLASYIRHTRGLNKVSKTSNLHVPGPYSMLNTFINVNW